MKEHGYFFFVFLNKEQLFVSKRNTLFVLLLTFEGSFKGLYFLTQENILAACINLLADIKDEFITN